MAKKFRMPPPINPGGEKFLVDLNDRAEAEKVVEQFHQSIVPILDARISEKFLPYLRKKLAPIFAVRADKYALADSLGWATSVLIQLYIGRRVGNLELRLEGTTAGSQQDTNAVISACIDQFREVVGEQQTTQIFQQLEKLTDEVLEQEFGKSRGKE